MQEVLDRLLEEEKKAERIITEAREKASSLKSGIEQTLSERTRELKEQTRDIVEKAVSEASEQAENRYRDEIKKITGAPVSLKSISDKDLERTLEKGCSLLTSTDIA